jgi:hypothetical protein
MPADQYDLTRQKPKNARAVPVRLDLMVDTRTTPSSKRSAGPPRAYVIPRWQTVPGSPYAHSPATVVALPDARMLQQISLTLLEAGQKAVDPPLKATKRGDPGRVNAYAGALTWVDAEYDERMGAALEPLIRHRQDEPRLGRSPRGEDRALIQEAFFLNVINLPEAAQGDKMTAYETAGAGQGIHPPRAAALRADGDRIQRRPLRDDVERLHGPQRLRVVRGHAADPGQPRHHLAVRKPAAGRERARPAWPCTTSRWPSAMRDAVVGSGAPADWIPTEEEAAQAKEAARKEAMLAQIAQAAQVGGDAATSVGGGLAALQQVAANAKGGAGAAPGA